MTTNNETSEENTTVTTESIVTNITDATSQSIFNQKSITIVESSNELEKLDKWDLRSVYVNNDGKYDYSVSKSLWVKDETYNTYDFKSAQPIQYYFDQLNDWNDAIELAQLNMFIKGYSPKMIFPSGVIKIKRPIWGAAALGMYLNEKYPDLGIYNSTNNTFLAYPPLIIEGQGRDATTIEFAGGKGRGTPDDLTWVNYGAIHTAPYDVLEQCSGNAKIFYHQGYWTRVNLKGFTLYGYNSDTNGDRPNCHGIVLFRGNRAFVSDVVINCFNGAGLLCDGYYDSFLEKFEIFQCGRMSPVYGEYKTKKLTTLDYQTYAPLHVMKSDIGDGWDNCNFLRFLNFHIEDNYNAVADIIVTGDSSPIWIENIHFECDSSDGIGQLGTKTVIALGEYGVSRFAQDGIENYVYGSEKFTGNGGGYVYWSRGAGYVPAYADGIVLGQYTQLNIDNLEFPNALSVSINGGNASALLKANKCSFGSINNSANASQIQLTDCNISSYKQSYGLCPVMNNVNVSGPIEINNSLSTLENMIVLNNVTCEYATGTIQYGNVNLVSTSSTTGTTLFISDGSNNIYDNYIVNTLGELK